MLLDEIKEYAKFGTTGGGIIEFLRESGFGAAAICSRSRTDGENATDSVLVTRIVQVWKTYLSGAIRFELNTVQNPATG